MSARKRKARSVSEGKSTHGGTYGGQVGRAPIDLDSVVDRTPDGQPITLMDRAVETLRFGGFTADVAARCGVSVATVREWERIGTATLVALQDGSKRTHQLTPAERNAARFVTACTKAEADGKMLLLGLAESLSRGGAVQKVTTVKANAKTGVVETTTKEIPALPDSQMIRWRLERRWPADFGPKQAVEITGKDGGPVRLDIPESVRALYAGLDRLATEKAEGPENEPEAPENPPQPDT